MHLDLERSSSPARPPRNWGGFTTLRVLRDHRVVDAVVSCAGGLRVLRHHLVFDAVVSCVAIGRRRVGGIKYEINLDPGIASSWKRRVASECLHRLSGAIMLLVEWME